jgi:hypothetical protein
MDKVVGETKPVFPPPQNGSAADEKPADHKKDDDCDITEPAKKMDAAKKESRRGRIEHRYSVKVVDNDEKGGDPA